MLVWIVLGVLSLVVLIGAYFASQRWHWAHVLVLVAFYAASVGYWLLAAQTLETRTKLQEQEFKALENLAKEQQLLDAIEVGTDDRRVVSGLAGREVLMAEEADEVGGLVEQRHQLRMLNRDRGRVWRNAVPTSEVDQQTGAVTIGVPVPRPPVVEGEEGFGEEANPSAPAVEPGPLGLSPDSVVYIFEQGPAGGGPDTAEKGYLGEFRVLELVADREARIEPLGQLELDPYAAQRLMESRGPWILYESMPVDDRDLFARLSEEQLKALMPAESVEEFLRDGGPVTGDDPELNRQGLDADGLPVSPDEQDKAVSYRYRRTPRDYGYLFKELSRERAELVAGVQAAQSDILKLQAALEGAEQLRAFRQDEIAKLESDLTALRRDQAAIGEHVAALESQIAKAERLLAQTLQANAAIARDAASASGNLVPVATGALDVDAL